MWVQNQLQTWYNDIISLYSHKHFTWKNNNLFLDTGKYTKSLPERIKLKHPVYSIGQGLLTLEVLEIYTTLMYIFKGN